MELATTALKVVMLGMLIGAGARAAEWAIPAPSMRVIICTLDDVGRVDTCKTAAELLKARDDHESEGQ